MLYVYSNAGDGVLYIDVTFCTWVNNEQAFLDLDSWYFLAAIAVFSRLKSY